VTSRESAPFSATMPVCLPGLGGPRSQNVPLRPARPAPAIEPDEAEGQMFSADQQNTERECKPKCQAHCYGNSIGPKRRLSRQS
jgi:hypothetical protein